MYQKYCYKLNVDFWLENINFVTVADVYHIKFFRVQTCSKLITIQNIVYVVFNSSNCLEHNFATLLGRWLMVAISSNFLCPEHIYIICATCHIKIEQVK
jgi:hypothetical protein